MKPKGLALYQAEQKRLSSSAIEAQYEKIVENAKRHQVDFLQNRELLKEIIDMPDTIIKANEVKKIEQLLLWLARTQESVELS
ncbi:MAG: hypothetical protein JW802_11385 [Campylobacterales bacterium]|nr:hypothetical protein [Campylobacterales bacterium]